MFEENELIQTWIVYHLQIVGEASAAMSEAICIRHPEVPWLDMSDFRNLLVHEDFRIDTEIIWAIVPQELPRLKTQLETMLQNYSSE
ncbi:HepT-like ribonuclease domain-containing protein [Phormidium sp. CCY1219]|uniref:HepT-like ribonuclease domain-containing protein n=1 Tax=Phormidium sp. CCY1219 TaxID=2886104 RepID=UPI002D788BFB|nr:HepT-like ribonuclease domain-containing protein [Phormidium sp. CCY1219]